MSQKPLQDFGPEDGGLLELESAARRARDYQGNIYGMGVCNQRLEAAWKNLNPEKIWAFYSVRPFGEPALPVPSALSRATQGAV